MFNGFKFNKNNKGFRIQHTTQLGCVGLIYLVINQHNESKMKRLLDFAKNKFRKLFSNKSTNQDPIFDNLQAANAHLAHLKSKEASTNISKLYNYLSEHREKDNAYWQIDGDNKIHDILMEFSRSDYEELRAKNFELGSPEQYILRDITYEIVWGLEEQSISMYSMEERTLIADIAVNLNHFLLMKEARGNRNDYSISKSKNPNVLNVHSYIIENKFSDSDYWSQGGGSNHIQYLLNEFGSKDWNALQADVIHWFYDEIEIFIESIGYDYIKHYENENEDPDNLDFMLDDKQLPFAGKFLLGLFIDNIRLRNEIAAYFHLILNSDQQDPKELKIFKNWMRARGRLISIGLIKPD